MRGLAIVLRHRLPWAVELLSRGMRTAAECRMQNAECRMQNAEGECRKKGGPRPLLQSTAGSPCPDSERRSFPFDKLRVRMTKSPSIASLQTKAAVAAALQAAAVRETIICSMDHEALPGYALVRDGVRDLGAGVRSAASLLVLIGATRLRGVGVEVPAVEVMEPEHELYLLLAAEDSDSAHGRYNALIRELVSFERAAECAA